MHLPPAALTAALPPAPRVAPQPPPPPLWWKSISISRVFLHWQLAGHNWWLDPLMFKCLFSHWHWFLDEKQHWSANEKHTPGWFMHRRDTLILLFNLNELWHWSDCEPFVFFPCPLDVPWMLSTRTTSFFMQTAALLPQNQPAKQGWEKGLTSKEYTVGRLQWSQSQQGWVGKGITLERRGDCLHQKCGPY